MSTRSCVARALGDGWMGRYVHSDGYPTCRGRELWQLLHVTFDGDVDAMLAVLIDQHPAGWSHLGGDWSKTPGYRNGYGSPELSYHEWVMSAGPACYCHGARSESENTITHDASDPLFIEWVYVFSPSHLTILASTCCDPSLSDAVDYGEYSMRHTSLVSLWLFDSAGNPMPQPDWKEIERVGAAMKEDTWRAFGPEYSAA